MNNYLANALRADGCTPTKRLGLSRKRRSSSLYQVHKAVSSAETTEGCSKTKVKEQGNLTAKAFSKSSEVKENIENKSENKNELVKSVIDVNQKFEKQIKDLENLYSVWANGFKNALLYFINLLQNKQSESINVKQLLKDLKIWEVASAHFCDDPDLWFFLNDNE